MKIKIFIFSVVILFLFGCVKDKTANSDLSNQVSEINKTLKGINQNTIRDFLIDSGMVSKPVPREDVLIDKRKIIITTKINNISSKEIIAKLFILEALDNAAPINLYIRSTGGWLEDAFAIVNTMNSIKPKVNVIAIGPVCSSGTLILMSATGARKAYSSSYIMVHANRKKKNQVPYNKENIVTEIFESLFKLHTRIPNEWYPLSGNKYYITPIEAKKFGLIDTVITK